MKKLLLSILVMGAGVSTVFAETATLDFTYAQDELFPFGKGKKEAIDVAICINNASLAGKKLTGFKAYISTGEGIESTSLWLSKELTLESKVNVPDIMSVDVNPVAATVGEYELQVLETTLAEPYVLTGDPLYVGYSMTVTNNKSDEEKNPIILSQGVNENGFFLHMKQSVLKWMDYSQNANGVAFIVAQIEGEYPPYSLGLQSYSTIYTESDKSFSVDFNAYNVGVNPINQVAYSYSVDDGEIKTAQANLDVTIEPQLALTSPLSLSFEGISGVGPHTIDVTITEVNGQKNESTAASLTCVANVIPFMPVHRPLVEEFTGLWCGWCTRGYIAMEMIAEEYGQDVVAIAYHNGDPMAVTSNYPVNVPGFPSSSLNRNKAIDPYYGSSDATEFGIGNDINASMDEIAIADIQIDAAIEGETVNVETNVTFIQNLDNANYQIGYVLVCNGLKGQTWAQANYYSGEKGYDGSPLEVLTKWSDPVAGLTFNDVAVDVSAMSGIQNTIPQTIEAGKAYSHSYTFNIAGNDLVQNPENLVVTTFIIDKTNGKVINANKYDFYYIAGIDSVISNAEVVKTEYFNLSGIKVSNPQNGIFIQRSLMNDGTVKAKKILVK